MSTATKPIATHKLSNGWTIVEHESESSIYVGPNKVGPGLGRYRVRYRRIPSTQRLLIFHFQGSTYEERRYHLGVGVWIAQTGGASLPWWRRRLSNGRNWGFVTTIGDLIDEAEEFRRLSLSLLSNEVVDMEFNNIVEKFEMMPTGCPPLLCS